MVKLRVLKIVQGKQVGLKEKYSQDSIEFHAMVATI